jgi:hypothetical protein
MPIEPGQTYQQCDPRVVRVTRLRIEEVHAEHAEVRYLDTGRRGVIFGKIRLSQLHASPTTRDGQPRRTGYALETNPAEEF